MKRKRHNPEQIIRKLRDADRMLSEGKDIALVCQSLEVSEATFHRWRNQYGGMKADVLVVTITRPGRRVRSPFP